MEKMKDLNERFERIEENNKFRAVKLENDEIYGYRENSLRR
jgi:hypothetical protein